MTENLTVTYPGRVEPVLDHADLTVRTGERVAILGPSGSGKSTLLSVLGGLVRPTGGDAFAQDDAGDRLNARLDHVTSWILQTTNVLPERTAVDNVAIAARAGGADHETAHAAAREALAAVGLAGQADQRAGRLSGGEVQRAVTARAIVSGRPFILADEPTGQLDRRSTETVLEALFAVVAPDVGSPTGLVVVTHDPLVAARCDRTVRIENGKVVA